VVAVSFAPLLNGNIQTCTIKFLLQTSCDGGGGFSRYEAVQLTFLKMVV